MALAALIFSEGYTWMLQRCYTKVVMEKKEFQRNTNYNSNRAKIQKQVQILKILWIRLFFAKNLRLRKKLKKWVDTNLWSTNKNRSSNCFRDFQIWCSFSYINCLTSWLNLRNFFTLAPIFYYECAKDYSEHIY